MWPRQAWALPVLLIFTAAPPLSRTAPLPVLNVSPGGWVNLGGPHVALATCAVLRVRGGGDDGDDKGVGGWSKKEEETLVGLVQELGRRWTDIRTRMVRPREQPGPLLPNHDRTTCTNFEPFAEPCPGVGHTSCPYARL